MHGQLAGVRPLRDRDRGVAGCEPDVRQAEQHHPDDHQGNDPTGGVDPLCLHDDAFLLGLLAKRFGFDVLIAVATDLEVEAH